MYVRFVGDWVSLGCWLTNAESELRDVSQTTILYRPIGQYEFELIAMTGFRAFPPRLDHQPIFYPVLTEAYAVEIARDWNTRDAASGYVGYVTQFAVESAFLDRYPVQVAGARRHQELWVPAGDLAMFNQHIIGAIEVIAEFRGVGEANSAPAT
jgi:hypothetical protein